jgi:hypothetical protein
LIESYERLSRKLLKRVTRIDEREETLKVIRNMVDRNGGIHLLRDRVIERIYDTAWTINGVPIMGRTSGWNWYATGGVEEATRMAGYQTTMVANAYAADSAAPLQWASFLHTIENSPNDVITRNPQQAATNLAMYTGGAYPSTS